jgi:hypothetical protein
VRRCAADLGHHSVKVALLSPYPDITSFGVGTLSSHLREAVSISGPPENTGRFIIFEPHRCQEQCADNP